MAHQAALQQASLQQAAHAQGMGPSSPQLPPPPAMGMAAQVGKLATVTLLQCRALALMLTFRFALFATKFSDN